MSRYANFSADKIVRRGASNGVVTVLETNGTTITHCKGTTVPANGLAGYAVGCEFVKTDASNQAVLWKNLGTTASCQFRPVGENVGYGIANAGLFTCVTGSASQTIALPGMGISAAAISFADYQASDDTDRVLAQIAAAEKISVTLSADPLAAHALNYAVLRQNVVPSYEIFAAGTVATVGGAAAEDFAISGVLATDLAFAAYSATDDTDSIAKVVTAANKITVTFSANPGATHGIHYVVLRQKGTFKPSHYIYAAGVHTTVGGSAAEAITVAGAKSTDVAIVNYNTTDDTDAILKAVLTTNTLTVTMSADPSTAHKLAYMILRAY